MRLLKSLPRSIARSVLRLLGTTGLLALPAAGAAHDIPADITVRAFVKPEGQHLLVLLRVPLGAIVDIEFPQRGPGYLDFPRVDPLLSTAALRWMSAYAEVYENDRLVTSPRVLGARISLPADRSFGTYEGALAHLTQDPALTNDEELVWNQGVLDALYDFPIQSDRSDLSINPIVERMGIRVTTVLRFLPPGGAVRAFEFAGDPGVVRLDPGFGAAARQFIKLGFLHILDGADHLLFLFCLVIPFRRVRPLILVITAFTVAHSITLISSAYDLVPNALWFPPLIETLIAVTIVYMALENIVSPRLERRWLIAFGFGLIHGFGFAFALRESLQFAGSHLLASLLSFNLGVELGQVLVLVLLVPSLRLVFHLGLPERAGVVVLSALVTHSGWHWMLERAERLRQFRVEWPAPTLGLLATAIRWLMLLLISLGAAWLIYSLLRNIARPSMDDDVKGRSLS